jgi:hypothetical protein
LVSELEDCWGTVVVNCCCYKLVAEAGDSSGTQSKGNVRCWKLLPSNGSEDVTGDTSVCVCVTVYCKVLSCAVSKSPVNQVINPKSRLQSHYLVKVRYHCALKSYRNSIINKFLGRRTVLEVSSLCV